MEADLTTINIVLGLIGIGMTMMMLSGEVEDGRLMRWCFLSYFVVVLDLNFNRASIFPNYLILLTAGLALVFWSYVLKPVEESSFD